MGWGYYPKTSPLPVQDGIRAKSRRGAIGDSWWSKRFLEALHKMGMDNRLERGRRYARKGQVANLTIKDGGVIASVQGSNPKPYRVGIRLTLWSEKQWEKVIGEISDQAIYSAELLAGGMPHEIEDVIHATGVNLFPASRKDLETDCSCPDYANPCKHIAAVYYILAERFDEDPFLIFALRGKGREEFLAALRDARGAREPVPRAQPHESGAAAAVPAPAVDSLVFDETADFFALASSLDDFDFQLTEGDEVKGSVIKRLGPSPLFVGKKNFTDLIAPVYVFAPEAVRRIIHGDDDPDAAAEE